MHVLAHQEEGQDVDEDGRQALAADGVQDGLLVSGKQRESSEWTEVIGQGRFWPASTRNALIDASKRSGCK